MKIYLVGGAVRDELLNLPVNERDWVVVGSSPNTMLEQGFTPVGKEFPVFLHPETHEEYALARTERKVGKGYKGFTFHADPSVTLEEDLKRRDLTVNAIAKDTQGNLIDPYGGQKDLTQKILRHVSPAFCEDPVRILRLARFASKLPDFTIDSSTNTLMKKMVANGEVDALVCERVWKELQRALLEKNPNRFFDVLEQCDALELLFPELEAQRPDINIMHLSAPQRFALLLKNRSEDAIKTLCKRYKTPSEFSELALLCHNLKTIYNTLDTAQAILLFLKRSDALRRPERFITLLDVLSYEHNNHSEKLKTALAAIKNVDTQSLQKQGLKGKDFADALEQLQIDAIQNCNF